VLPFWQLVVPDQRILHLCGQALAEKEVQRLEYFQFLRALLARLHGAGTQRDRIGNCKVKRSRGHFDPS
jgi:hypothetical protein